MGKWAFALAFLLLAGCDAGPTDACRPGDDVICGLNRPEDIEIVPNTRWLMVSELGRGEVPGHVLLVDPETKEKRVLSDAATVADPSTFPRCGEPPKELHPRGFHLSAADDGTYRLLVLTPRRVERYRVTVTGDDVALAWEGCVDVPKEVAGNDIAAVVDRGFVVSHMFPASESFQTKLNLTTVKLVLGLNTGAAYRWTRDGGWARIPNSDASFGNGIQVDPKTGRVYMASMFNQRILAFDLDGSHPQQSARTRIQNDNLSWGPDGRLVGVGHTGVGVIGTMPCQRAEPAPCAFPFAVLAYDPVTLQTESLFEQQKGNIPGASVAVVKDGFIYLGSSFGDRITRVKLKAPLTTGPAPSVHP